MIIRKAESSDFDNLVELMINSDNREKTWAEEKAGSYTNSNKKLILVAEDNGKLIGFAGVKKYEDNGARAFVDLDNFIWITWIAVLPEFRKKNVGSALLKAADNYIKFFEKSGIVLDCRRKVVEFYQKNNYKLAGEYQYNGEPRFVMEKSI